MYLYFSAKKHRASGQLRLPRGRVWAVRARERGCCVCAAWRSGGEGGEGRPRHHCWQQGVRPSLHPEWQVMAPFSPRQGEPRVYGVQEASTLLGPWRSCSCTPAQKRWASALPFWRASAQRRMAPTVPPTPRLWQSFARAPSAGTTFGGSGPPSAACARHPARSLSYPPLPARARCCSTASCARG